MIKISKQADYALQFILALNKAQNRPLSLMKFSKESNISFLFMQKIAKRLRESDLINSEKGSAGGYTLARDISKMNLKELIQVVDGSVGTTACTKEGSKCYKEHNCVLKPKLQEINRELTGYMESVSLASFVN